MAGAEDRINVASDGGASRAKINPGLAPLSDPVSTTPVRCTLHGPAMSYTERYRTALAQSQTVRAFRI